MHQSRPMHRCASFVGTSQVIYRFSLTQQSKGCAARWRFCRCALKSGSVASFGFLEQRAPYLCDGAALRAGWRREGFR
jgi:hypothetical protein